MFGFKACPHPYPYLKTQVGQIFIFQQSRHKASLRVSASANFKSLCVTRFDLKTDGLRPYYASFVFGGNYCPSCCWWSLSSAEVPAGYPYKNSNNREKKSALGTMRRGKSFVTFSTTTETISSELSLICSWTFDFNSSYRGQIPVKEMGLKYYLVCYSPNVGFDRLLTLWPCQLMNSTKKKYILI